MAESKTVKELMINKFVKVNQDDSLFEVATKVSEDRETLLACVVDKKDKLTGIITPKELLKAAEICEYGGSKHPFFSPRELLHLLTSRYAQDLMRDPISVKPDDTVQKAIDIMIDKGFYEIPVIDDENNIIGEINYLSVISTSVWHCNEERE